MKNHGKNHENPAKEMNLGNVWLPHKAWLPGVYVTTCASQVLRSLEVLLPLRGDIRDEYKADIHGFNRCFLDDPPLEIRVFFMFLQSSGWRF